MIELYTIHNDVEIYINEDGNFIIVQPSCEGRFPIKEFETIDAALNYIEDN